MMGINLRVPIDKNGTVGGKVVPNLNSKVGMTRVGIKIKTGGTKVGTRTTRIKIGPNLRKEVNLIMRIGNMTLTSEMTTPEAEAWPLPDPKNAQQNRSLLITLTSEERPTNSYKI